MVVSAEEGLRPGEDVPDDDGGAEGIDDVLVIGVK